MNKDLVIRQLPLGPCQANAYLVWREGRDDAFIIDPGDDVPALREAIRESGKRLTDILITHGHFDHILGTAALKKEFGARVHVHPFDQDKLLSREGSLCHLAWCQTEFEPVEADAPFPTESPFELDVCGVHFTGYRTPGHTPGCVCLMDAEDKVIFTGDTLFAHSYGRTDFPGGNEEEMRQSLLFLLHLDRELTVYSGHEEADTLAAIARRWRL